MNGTVVLPGLGPSRMDLGIKDGRIAAISDTLAGSDGAEVIDARHRHVLPGAVDSHCHIGIYRPFSEDALSESTSAVAGGTTTMVSYFRTGSHYLNKTGAYRQIFPEVLKLSVDQFRSDYSYHVAPMTNAHLDEMEWLVDQGVGSFKLYMFYKSLTLSSDSTKGKEYTMSDDYDLGYLYEIMERAAALSKARGRRISLSLHCENPELIRTFIARIKAEGLTGLEAYSRARPALSEELAIEEAVVLSHATGCAVNLLHLSSGPAVTKAIEVKRRYPNDDILLEATLHHLMLNWGNAGGYTAKVNPPIRTPQDQEVLWAAVKNGDIATVVSDHACLSKDKKEGDFWAAWPGFGGTGFLYPVLISEGVLKRGLPLERAVDLVSATPARSFGLYPKKGAIAVGSDADLSIVDLEAKRTVTAASVHSAQDFTPFEGMKLSGWPAVTVLRGQVVFKDGEPHGKPSGQFVKRS
ncbi:MAG: amidohydrolase family protein [Acidobacteria bacterium]|nr:amidohydrolase family protein [Acidobacteriota bacterium]